MTKVKMKYLFGLLLAGLIVLAGVQAYRYIKRPKGPTAQAHVVQVAQISEKHNEGMPQVGGPFSLVDPRGRIITEKSFPHKFLVLYFGYSFCPDICPTALLNITDAMKALGHEANKMQVLFITLDPERDTKEVLATYIQNFDKRILPLTGTPEQLTKVTKAYRVFWRKMTPENTTDYVVDHSSIIYMMNPQGQLVRHFHHQTPVQTLVHEMKQALQKGS